MSDAPPTDDGEVQPQRTAAPSDTEGAAAAIDVYQEDKQERQQEFNKSLSKKERLERRRDARTTEVVLFDETLTFSFMDGEDAEWLEDLGEMFSGTDEEDLSDEQFVEYKRARERSKRMLGDLSRDPELDAEFWGTFEPEFRNRLLMELRQKQTEDTTENVEFR